MTVNYTINEWLDEADLRVFEEMRLRDPERYRVCGLGEWGVGGGRFFPELQRSVHVLPPAPLPPGARIYRSIDYGLDALACLFIAVDSAGRATVFREVYAHDLIVSEAAEAIRDASAGLDVYCTFAPPDLWSRQKDSGKSIATLFARGGVPLSAADNNRIGGWLSLKEWLKPKRAPDGGEDARMKIFSSCENLIRCLFALTGDKKRIGDCETDPHEITHLPDALRYFAVMQTSAPRAARPVSVRDFTGQNGRRKRF